MIAVQLPNNQVASKNPAVSVIINCLNGAKYLREALDSVFAQTYTDWEIVFWDNASTDNSTEIAKGYGEKVRYFRSKKTVPLGKARNWAIEQSRGKYIAFLDCDDVWMPTKLEKQIPIFEQNPKLGLVYSKLIHFNNKGYVHRPSKEFKLHRGHVFGKLLKGNFIPLQSAVIRRDALDNLNEWFDERFNMVEDGDLFLRIAHNYEVGYVDESLAKRRMHKESWSFAKKDLYYGERTTLINKLKNLYPNISKEFGYELKLMESEMFYNEALICWEKRERRKARQLLKPFLRFNKKLFFPYILSHFLSHRLYILVLRLCGKHVYIT